ncbi:Proteasome maturation protein [Halotydeus destructor]|nr:Proteasome maturation protein [Halotydeus destructor]
MALPGTSSKLGLSATLVEERQVKINPEKSAMLHGFNSTPAYTSVHPLDVLQQNYRDRVDATNFAILKQTQGVHAPLKLMMERQAASKIGRLPFLPSSNIMRDVLEGRDDDIDFEDFLNDPTQPEYMGAAHLVVERQLGVL